MRIVIAVFAAVLLFRPAIADADSFIYVNDSNGNLLTVNPTTGALMVVGNTGTVLLDIAFAPTGDLYGISASELYRINPSTAAATRIGVLSTDEPPANQFANALTFGSNGTFYAASFATTAIYTIALLTGRASSIGTTGFASSGDLAFSNGSFFLAAT